MPYNDANETDFSERSAKCRLSGNRRSSGSSVSSHTKHLRQHSRAANLSRLLHDLSVCVTVRELGPLET